MDNFYTSAQVATMLGVSQRRIQALAKTRGLGRMVGHTMVFTESEVTAMRVRKRGRPKKNIF